MILTYHEIVEDDSRYIYSVTKANLKAHLARIRRQTVILPDQPAAVEITFDDGHISHYELAFPVLEELGLKATFCITAGWTDQAADYMTAAQLRELLASGHRIFAHGWTHRMLTRCTPSELHQELSGAKRALEDVLGTEVVGMSAPHGRWNQRVLQTCADAGYSSMYVSEPDLSPRVRSGVRVAGRIMVTRQTSPDTLLRDSGETLRHKLTTRTVQIGKLAVRRIIGEEQYRRMWRRLGSKTQDLPDVAIAKPRPTVLQLISSGGYYGAESMLLNLSQALRDKNVDVVIGVFANSQNPHTEIADRARAKGLECHIIPCRGRWDQSAVEEIRRLIYKRGVDIVHCHGSKANTYAAFAVGRLPLSLIATYHIDWPDRGWLLRLYHVCDRLVLRRFARIVAVSEPIQASLRRSGLPAERISTIKNGIDIAPFAAFAMSRAGKDQTADRRIGIVGRLTPQKGHQFLVAAIPEILGRFPNTSFVFVGEGPESEKLKRQVSTLKIEKNVIFAGSQENMAALYASLDILVLPSLNEGMPMTLIEALASKLPVIATAVGDVPKLIVHNKTGLLVRPGKPDELRDALFTLLSDEQGATAMGCEGHRLVSQDYSAPAMADKYVAVYVSTSSLFGESYSGSPGQFYNTRPRKVLES